MFTDRDGGGAAGTRHTPFEPAAVAPRCRHGFIGTACSSRVRGPAQAAPTGPPAVRLGDTSQLSDNHSRATAAGLVPWLDGPLRLVASRSEAPRPASTRPAGAALLSVGRGRAQRKSVIEGCGASSFALARHGGPPTLS